MSLLKNIGVLCAIALFATKASAENSAPLMLDNGLISTVSPRIALAVSEKSAGAIHFPDQIAAMDLAVLAKDDPLVAQFTSTHDFYLLDFAISIQPKPEFTPEAVRISGRFSGGSKLERKLIVRHVFPETQFSEPSFGINGSLEIRSGLRFSSPIPSSVSTADASVEVKGNLAVDFEYKPVYAKMTAGYGGSSFFWMFQRSQQWIPTGALPLKLIIMRPKSSTRAFVDFDVSIDFSRNWWLPNKRALAAHRVRILLPQ